MAQKILPPIQPSSNDSVPRWKEPKIPAGYDRKLTSPRKQMATDFGPPPPTFSYPDVKVPK